MSSEHNAVAPATRRSEYRALALMYVAQGLPITHKLPLAALDFYHRYTPVSTQGEPAQIMHGVVIRGLLAPLFGFLIGRAVKKHLRTAMLKLVAKAVQ